LRLIWGHATKLTITVFGTRVHHRIDLANPASAAYAGLAPSPIGGHAIC
jgi:hypothetical protein